MEVRARWEGTNWKEGGSAFTFEWPNFAKFLSSLRLVSRARQRLRLDLYNIRTQAGQARHDDCG